MIPHSLQISNFLSYGSDLQTIDFRPYHLMYLSGKNGHGKSALLDALTWALWGHARKTINAVKPDQGLLRLGTTHMMVLLDFEVGGQSYRVKREFIQTQAKQVAYLEFGLINENGTIVPLTDKTIRATQEVIERTIRLDYESFVNSAFLRQGHANEFSQKSPKDRKEILSTILGLQQFDFLKRRALEKAKQALEQRQALSTVCHALMEQLVDTKDITLQVQQFNIQVKEIQHAEQILITEKKQFEDEQNAWSLRQKEYELLAFKHAQMTNTYKEQLVVLQKVWQQWRAVHGQQGTLPDYKALEAEKKDIVLTIQMHQQTLQKRITLQETALKFKQELQQRQQLLEIEHAQQLQQLQVAVERMKFEKQALEKNIDALKALGNELSMQHVDQHKNNELITKQLLDIPLFEKMIAQFEKRKAAYQQFIAKVQWLKTESENREHKKDVAHGNDPSCPLCEQNLSAARRKFLANRFLRQERLGAHQLKRLQSVITQLKQILVEQHRFIEQQTALRNQKEMLAKEIFAGEQKNIQNNMLLLRLQDESKVIESTLEQQQKYLENTKQKATLHISNDLCAREKIEAIERIAAELATLVYDETAHAKVERQREQIEKKLTDLVVLHHEILNQNAREEQLKNLVYFLKQQKKEINNNVQLLKHDEILVQEKKRLELRATYFQEQLNLLQERKEKVREEHGRIKTRQEQIDRIQKEQKKHQDSITKLNKEIEDYQIIATAAGKDGIQALLIEEAIPEIEQETNYLLGKLTNNQAHIFIESLRDLKSGGSKETLDINISDPSGIRPYEMFSGGEAFRIDFALRIAISKLLARRAGTALQTLIIDEGFGSQDEEGLSLIMDAIYKIQDDFEKVIVVSHLPSMRDQFPVHFVVEKGPTGSRLSVIEQG